MEDSIFSSVAVQLRRRRNWQKESDSLHCGECADGRDDGECAAEKMDEDCYFGYPTTSDAVIYNLYVQRRF